MAVIVERMQLVALVFWGGQTMDKMTTRPGSTAIGEARVESIVKEGAEFVVTRLGREMRVPASAVVCYEPAPEGPKPRKN